MTDYTISALPTERTAPIATDRLAIDNRDNPLVPVTEYIKLSTLHAYGNRYISLPVKALHPTTTAGCASLATIEMGTNKQTIEYLAFDKDTDENAEISFVMPPNWDGGVIYCTPYWAHPAAATFGVVWGFKGRSYADGDSLDQAFGTAVLVSDTGGTTSDIYIAPETAAITLAGTPAGGQKIDLVVYRDANHATDDTLNADAYLTDVLIKYTVS